MTNHEQDLRDALAKLGHSVLENWEVKDAEIARLCIALEQIAIARTLDEAQKIARESYKESNSIATSTSIVQCCPMFNHAVSMGIMQKKENGRWYASVLPNPIEYCPWCGNP